MNWVQVIEAVSLYCLTGVMVCWFLEAKTEWTAGFATGAVMLLWPGVILIWLGFAAWGAVGWLWRWWMRRN